MEARSATFVAAGQPSVNSSTPASWSSSTAKPRSRAASRASSIVRRKSAASITRLQSPCASHVPTGRPTVDRDAIIQRTFAFVREISPSRNPVIAASSCTTCRPSTITVSQMRCAGENASVRPRTNASSVRCSGPTSKRTQPRPSVAAYASSAIVFPQPAAATINRMRWVAASLSRWRTRGRATTPSSLIAPAPETAPPSKSGRASADASRRLREGALRSAGQTSR